MLSLSRDLTFDASEQEYTPPLSDANHRAASFRENARERERERERTRERVNYLRVLSH